MTKTITHYRSAVVKGALALIFLFLGALQADAASKRHLFHEFTGMRMDRYRSPTPLSVPGAKAVTALQLKARLQQGNLILIDVMPDANARYLADDRKWLITRPRKTLPGAVWLVNVGFGDLSPDMESYFREQVKMLAQEKPGVPIVVFCQADCWMSWNAIRRLVAWGYTDLLWFRNGTDGWLDHDLTLKPARPAPLPR